MRLCWKTLRKEVSQCCKQRSKKVDFLEQEQDDHALCIAHSFKILPTASFMAYKLSVGIFD